MSEEVAAVGETRFSTQHSEGGRSNAMRFCGRCQSWLPDVIEIHACLRAPRVHGYEWREADEPAFEKNAILHEGRKAKRGALIAKFLSEQSAIARFPSERSEQ